jgi:hypothetical protein
LNEYNVTSFTPVTIGVLRLEIKARRQFPTGVIEWKEK